MTLTHTIRSLLLATSLFFVSQFSFSQEKELDDLVKRFSIGVAGGHYQLDPVVGMEISSPLFATRLCFRVRTNVLWSEHYKASEDDWVTYSSLTTGVALYSNLMERTRVYLEIGSSNTFPDKRFTTKKHIQGIYGFTGIELFLEQKKNYVLACIFSVGTGYSYAHAEKLTLNPRYGSGLMFLIGLRLYR
jgi:hypothetical protein